MGAETSEQATEDVHRTDGAVAAAGRRAVHLAWFTIAYNVVEGVVAVTAGLASGLVSLIGFGIDSGIEVAAAAVVLRRLTADLGGGGVDERAERRDLRIIAGTFFALAVYLGVEGVLGLIGDEVPDASTVGVILTGTSLVVMPLLAHHKARAGRTMGSRLVVAEAAETRLCAWLSASTFAGLLAYGLLGWTWLDAVAGFVIAGFAVVEGREAWEGELVCEDDC